mgnify:CR=1 FL=1
MLTSKLWWMQHTTNLPLFLIKSKADKIASWIEKLIAFTHWEKLSHCSNFTPLEKITASLGFNKHVCGVCSFGPNMEDIVAPTSCKATLFIHKFVWFLWAHKISSFPWWAWFSISIHTCGLITCIFFHIISMLGVHDIVVVYIVRVSFLGWMLICVPQVTTIGAKLQKGIIMCKILRNG